jgi:protein transport protein SEC24
VYAVNPEASSIATPQAPPKEPWPNSLQPQLQTVRPSHASAAAGIGYTNAPYTHSEQPLPPELRPPSQPRPRIDPDQMPAPVTVRELDEELFADKFFGTLERERVPLATTQCIAFDQGLISKKKNCIREKRKLIFYFYFRQLQSSIYAFDC